MPLQPPKPPTARLEAAPAAGPEAGLQDRPRHRLLDLPVVVYLTSAVGLRIADEGGRVALVLLALQRVHSAAIGGLLVGALMIPHVVAAPVVGAATDWSSRPCRVIALFGLGFSAALAITAVSFGHVQTAVSVLVLILGGSCGPALTGALSSQTPGLTGAGQLTRMFGLDSLTYSVAGITGPAIAGTVAGLAGPTLACFTLVAFSAGGAILVATLPVSRHDADRSRPSLTVGLRAIGSRPPAGSPQGRSARCRCARRRWRSSACRTRPRSSTPSPAGWTGGSRHRSSRHPSSRHR